MVNRPNFCARPDESLRQRRAFGADLPPECGMDEHGFDRHDHEKGDHDLRQRASGERHCRKHRGAGDLKTLLEEQCRPHLEERKQTVVREQAQQ